MTTFVDTSAIYALLDADDANHRRASGWFREAGSAEDLVTHSYVVVETAALVHRRLGRQASVALFDAVLPAVEIEFVDAGTHAAAARAWLSFGSAASSFVDWVSFEVIGRRRVPQAFVFDADFSRQGIRVVP